ncbi:MAG: thioredoxin domain-containing protein, partial [Desulfobacterales bacterium]|nr:thioredoxin domain-containing protein [Desulfobacterales bacterium]
MKRLAVLGIAAAALFSYAGSGFADAAAGDAASGGAWGEALPGAEKFDGTLVEKFKKMKKSRGASYKPRTKHLRPDGWARYTNRLFLESSPYLIQHAHNPVNWRPWGDEAFEAARKLKRPVLLSVGYSTCHWCHVMEEESFENEEIARFLNENYIAVKVDREERPDVDAIYMSAVQAMTGRGGWPMTVWLTPDREAFYGGTYFPAMDGDRGTRVGFLSLLKLVKKKYHADANLVATSSREITDVIHKTLASGAGNGELAPESLHQAVRIYKERFDEANAGLRGAPKFPSTLSTRLLLRYFRRTGNKGAMEMARSTLDAMAAGGIYDHVGGGFHRYSTDEKWLVPHFEKMLYDNALLAMVYLEGWQATGNENFRRIVMEILDYVERDMTSPGGAFYSATDADSLTPDGHREEGWFFTWTPGELERILGKKKAHVVGNYYAVGPSPNFEGRHILHTPTPAEKVAADLGVSERELRSIVAEAGAALREVRNRRPRPSRDEKILTAWNGL